MLAEFFSKKEKDEGVRNMSEGSEGQIGKRGGWGGVGWGGEGLHRDIDNETCLQDQCGMSDHEMSGQLSALRTVTFIHFVCVQLHTLL